MTTDRDAASPLRIFYLTATSDRGGAETLLVELLSGLDRNAFECRVASFVGGGWLTRTCGELGVPSENWADRGGVGKLRALWRALREFRPHILHVFGLRAEIPGRPLARWAGVPVIVSVAHSPDPWRRPLHVCLDRMTARFVDRFIAVGRAVAASRVRRERFSRRKITIIPNGIRPPDDAVLDRREESRAELFRELELPDDAGPIVLMVGNLRRMKGHGEALEALAKLIPEFPEIRLVVVGRDVSGGRYDRRAEELGCADHVVWAGYREDPSPFYSAADLYWMPSYWEGSPTALLEAMAWRLPVIASRIGGIAEIARPGREALLVPPKDSYALAEAALKLLREPDRATALARAARERVLARYSLDRMVGDHERLYRELCRRTAKPHSRKAKQ